MRLTSGDRTLMPLSRPPAWMSAAIVAILAVIFVIDRQTGTAPVQHLYYLPIILASSVFTMRGGIAAALGAVALYHLANPHLLARQYQEPDAVQILLFFAVAVVTAKLANDNRRLRHLANTDDLTGLHNLRSFETRLAQMVKASDISMSSIGFLVIDLDNLKALNDRYGHLTGAEAVRLVGRLIARHVPAEAVACRYGGDEFAIVVPECGSIRTFRIAEELCQAVRSTAPALAGRSFPAATLTISAGATSAQRRELPEDDAAAGESLFRRADLALYEAKASGRNRVFLRADFDARSILSAPDASPYARGRLDGSRNSLLD
jgi:diguanylate cyclase (GGDEF)-like protein